jgi:hypothetical protein
MAKDFFKVLLNSKRYSAGAYTRRIPLVFHYVWERYRLKEEDLRSQDLDLEQVFSQLDCRRSPTLAAGRDPILRLPISGLHAPTPDTLYPNIRSVKVSIEAESNISWVGHTVEPMGTLWARSRAPSHRLVMAKAALDQQRW